MAHVRAFLRAGEWAPAVRRRAHRLHGAGTDAADYFPNDNLTASSAHMMTVRMMVGAYVVDLVPGPLLKDAPDCEEPQEDLENGEDNDGDEPQKCLE